MTLFQAIVYAIVHAFAEFLPVGVIAHDRLLPWALGWPMPTPEFAGAIQLGTLFACLVFFRHDWASMISSVIRLVVLRKRPMTVDERMPMFIALATAITGIGWTYLREPISSWFGEPTPVAITLVAGALLLGFADSFSRRNKGGLDWNWLDASVMGVFQILMLVPGGGRSLGGLSAGLLRNYSREAATKFTLFLAAPILGAAGIHNLRAIPWGAAAPSTDVSWLTFSIALLVSILASLLAIGGLMKQAQSRTFRAYATYRCVLAAALGIWIWGSGHGWF